MPQKTKETPMMVQYNEMKSQHPDAFLFFRLGDFYEMFNEDALKAAQILEITLTSRNKNADDPIPMCGIPYHSASEYIKTLVSQGYKVAIAEQLEDPKLTKGMVKRGIVKVITPGTYLNESIGINENNYLAALTMANNQYILAFSDVGTGELKVTTLDDFNAVLTEFAQLQSKELVVSEDISAENLEQLQHLQNFTLSHFSLTASDKDDTLARYQHVVAEVTDAAELQGLLTLLAYINSMSHQAIDHWQTATHYEVAHYLHMDYYAKSNLELTESVRTKKRQGSLLAFLNKTETAMGFRLLKQWLDRPLISLNAIEQRQNQVEDLIEHYFERLEIKELLHGVYDLERLVAKVAMGNVNPKELLQLNQSLSRVPGIIATLDHIVADNEDTDVWAQIRGNITDLPELTDMIQSAIKEDAPATLKDGNVIADGFDPQLDEYRDAMRNGQQWIAQLQADERAKTGIKSLKVGYNKVFGYYIEVTKANLHLLEEGRYDRKQTLTNAERFITPELKEMEAKILEAEEQSQILEHRLFQEVREAVKQHQVVLQSIAQTVATIDVLQSLAEISESHQYVKPIFTTDKRDLYLKDSRHPVVEGVIGQDKFVPNDIIMNPETSILMITGPNMSGKSTYMRQLGLIVILAQMGCFVPATEARLPIFDKIFTRIGAADDLLAGQSTFMVEMMEANQALQHATDASLLLFDELGRGTSTYDGIALAQAILIYIHDHFDAKVLFSTHYHELTALEETLPHLRNIHVGATEEDGELVFLHKVFDGATDKSYGIHVAELAGMPDSLLKNAQAVLKDLEANNLNEVNKDQQLSLFSLAEDDASANNQGLVVSQDEADVLDQLKQEDIYNLTPIQALNLLVDLKNKL
ncbi:DNA mismatch repair protein MutS [Aerococcus agrisoli]|uniref:DNA mismatch repair protein MutS n=1 Tax=Aerococcus agrisoli TaxID=2487350 RepID=A0A3N4GQD3_9LACT|nr:DNA mismatch repair protein MutS [Aerococcus agrisoli]RPA61291.1 DNA mismatch repair protein MutS [Aerococcus agrisoli]